MTIYIPDDLKARIDKAAKKHDVNWSALACAAFTEKLDFLERDRAMNNVIERLRMSKEKTPNAEQTFGRERGREWAMRKATADELERLEIIFVRLRSFPSEGLLDHSARALFHKTIRPDAAEDQRLCNEFWKDALGGDSGFVPIRLIENATASFIQGFALGAVEVWNEVKGKI